MEGGSLFCNFLAYFLSVPLLYLPPSVLLVFCLISFVALFCCPFVLFPFQFVALRICFFLGPSSNNLDQSFFSFFAVDKSYYQLSFSRLFFFRLTQTSTTPLPGHLIFLLVFSLPFTSLFDQFSLFFQDSNYMYISTYYEYHTHIIQKSHELLAHGKG